MLLANYDAISDGNPELKVWNNYFPKNIEWSFKFWTLKRTLIIILKQLERGP